MPFFFILPMWCLCVFAGAALLFVPRLRFLSSYLLFGSTIGLILSFGLSLAVLFVTVRFFGRTRIAWLAIVAYLAAIGIGGIFGIMAGLFVARRVNRKIRWLSADPPTRSESSQKA